MRGASTKSALGLILILIGLLWWFGVPSGNVIGNILAGAIMVVTIAALWTAK
jgi:hypothetical protein